MVVTPPGTVVIVRFPFSDLSASKFRPAIVLANSGGSDSILCQVTSNPYSDGNAVRLDDDDFIEGSLRLASFARPGKLFTADHSIVTGTAGRLGAAALEAVVSAVLRIIRHGA